jgi:COP9 signalosome complex subunit 2
MSVFTSEKLQFFLFTFTFPFPLTLTPTFFLFQELGVSIPEIEALLVSLILDGQIQGRIDQVNSVLLLESKRNLGRVRFTAIDKLTSQLHTLNKTISGKVV